jgi:hypothetical protein
MRPLQKFTVSFLVFCDYREFPSAYFVNANSLVPPPLSVFGKTAQVNLIHFFQELLWPLQGHYFNESLSAFNWT